MKILAELTQIIKSVSRYIVVIGHATGQEKVAQIVAKADLQPFLSSDRDAAQKRRIYIVLLKNNVLLYQI